MKKFFEKHDLFKVSGILVILAALLTWVAPKSHFEGLELVSEGITRIGLNDFLSYGILTAFYFTVLVTFLFVMGGFYQVLSKRPGYQKLTSVISEKLQGHEIPVVLVITLIFAILGSLAYEYFPLFALIPFFIAILSKMKVDKLVAFASTFGGLLVGIIGSTFSSKITGYIIQVLSIEREDILTTQTIIFVIAFVALSVFTIIRILKTKKKDKKFESYDLFAYKEETAKQAKNARMWPYAIFMLLFFLVTAISYLPWETWEIDWFTKATAWVNGFTIFDVPVFSYLFGNFIAFGTESGNQPWDINQLQIIMLVGTLLIKVLGKVPFDEIISSYGEGIKKMLKTTVLMLSIYLVVEIVVIYPVLPGLVNVLANLTDGFNAFFTSIGVFITSIFSGEMQYAVQFGGTFYATKYADFLPELAIIFQTMFGLASFVAPSSVIMMIGLSHLDIKYIDWLKFIWKFLLIMIVAIAIILFAIV